jgi:DNA end-binding protein Ku
MAPERSERRHGPDAPTPLRALWEGTIRLGKEEIPVKFYAALEDRDIHFRLLHRTDRMPVKQKMVDAGSGKEAPPESIRKGAEIRRGVYVLLEEEELAKLDPEPSRIITVERVVSRTAIGHFRYDRPYHLGPSEDATAYWSLAAALQTDGLEAIVRWVMRGKEYVGSLLAKGGFLQVITLRFADQVIEARELELPDFGDLSQQEINMADQLVSMLESPFDPAQYRNEFREKVLDLIETKARGGKVKMAVFKARTEPTSLSSALKNSIAQVRRQKRAA